MRSAASCGIWMRLSASAAADGGFERASGLGVPLGASLDVFLASLCSADADGSVGTVITFQRMPLPLSVTSMAVSNENLLFLAADEHRDLTGALGRLLGRLDRARSRFRRIDGGRGLDHVAA